MNIGFVINDFATEKAEYTTTYLAMAASRMGHRVWYMSVGDFAYRPDEMAYAHARTVPEGPMPEKTQDYLDALRAADTPSQLLPLSELNVLLLRNDPAQDVSARPWARLAGINFSRFAIRHGVVVVNDPDGLTQAINKMYLQYFPQEVRPRTLISQDVEEIKAFIGEEKQGAVLKPLSGSGGRNVFLVRPGEKANLNQMIDVVRSGGYVLVQEYLPEAAEGDVRLFMLNGHPLQREGRYAAFRRVRRQGDGDMRSNLSVGASAEVAEVDETTLRMAELVRPKLLQDGMFLVGLDIVAGKLTEINVFSPGGMNMILKLTGVDFCTPIIQALERKVDCVSRYQRHFDNRAIAIF